MRALIWPHVDALQISSSQPFTMSGSFEVIRLFVLPGTIIVPPIVIIIYYLFFSRSMRSFLQIYCRCASEAVRAKWIAALGTVVPAEKIVTM
jgi:hypothetical protein